MTTGIPTTYAGTNFRSRLEARWAAFFDLIGWTWVYEPVDARGYIPDFLISKAAPRAAPTVAVTAIEGDAGRRPFFVEVGPCATRGEYAEKALKPAQAELEHPVVVVGVSPTQLAEETIGWMVGGDEWPAFAAFGACPGCGAVCVTHSEGVFIHRPCGHYTGGDTGLSVGGVEDAWAEAGNTVQWRPR